MDIQHIIDKAVKIATRSAMYGHPVMRIDWIPPQSATADADGVFAITPCPPLGASQTPPWEQ